MENKEQSERDKFKELVKHTDMSYFFKKKEEDVKKSNTELKQETESKNNHL